MAMNLQDLKISKKNITVKNFRTKVYFAHPYCSWERGTNERHNRIIRKFIFKGTPIKNYSNNFYRFHNRSHK